MPEVDALRHRVLQLEELFSHHQHHVQQLNEVIVEVRRELDALHVKYAIQQRRLDTIQESQLPADGVDLADEKPPHY